MNKVEAKKVLDEELKKYSSYSFQELKKMIHNPSCYWVNDEYQVEVESLWEEKENENLLVMMSVDDGGFFSAMFPVTESFIITPQGKVL